MNELINMVRGILEHVTDEIRATVLRAITDGYCLTCGGRLELTERYLNAIHAYGSRIATDMAKAFYRREYVPHDHSKTPDSPKKGKTS